MLAILLLVVLQTPEPRFIMSPEPDDRFEAALFELEPGADLASLVAELLDSGSLRPENDPDRTYFFAAVEGSSTRRDRVCRIARTSAGQTNNLGRAMGWCASFIVPGAAPTVTVAPMNQPTN